MSTELIFSIIAVIAALIEALGILAAGHAVMNARTSQGAIAWAISLITLPLFALPFYAVFGRGKFNGYVLLRQVKDEKIQHVIQQCYIDATQEQLICEETTGYDTVLTRLANLPITRFNQSLLLIDGENTFREIFNHIDSAEEYILVQFFIVKDDRLGREFKARLIRKAQGNVRVYFLYDEIGSHKLPTTFISEMQAAGIVTSAFHSTRGKTNRFQLNFRNHRKIVIVDGNVAFVGGHNVGDEYVSKNPRFGRWRDTHVQVEGPVVKAIQYSFIQDWYWATTTIPGLRWKLQKSENGSEETLLIASGPADPLDTCALMFAHVINSAKERLWIASPYFIPDLHIMGALKLAALRGVDVRILLPEKPDHRTVYLASFAYYQDTLPVGIKLYRYTAGFMHQKVFLVDSNCAAVGTANLDNRSFRLNFELTLLNYDSAFVKNVEEMLQEDFSDSRMVDMSDYTRRHFLFKLAVRSARLLSPIL